MYAIIELGGQQWKVSPGMRLAVNRLPYEAGAEFLIDRALLIERDGQIQVGTPYLPASVQVKVEEHLRAPKVIVFKKKRRKGYKRKRGHRQAMTLVQIQSI
ncbi:MAG: 50S ribosomal protein L21 [Bacteroidia bacterium]|nr:50S ribosomal protein L21 [Bacteroidia bacterium]MCX7651324.1 50S ribosomal protein L21 [Bacteroidia bacterium]MDW8417156.1 50S ribosomal protein L21 [Bacteroidia bacterium]